MKPEILSGVGLTILSLLLTGGCVSRVQYDKCVRHNELANERIEHFSRIGAVVLKRYFEKQ